MSTAPRHLEFAPPPTPGLLRALVLAILAHSVLLGILTVGVQWKREDVQQSIEAELWSAVPQEAAPPAPEPVPEPEPPKLAQLEPKTDLGPTPAEIKAQSDIAIAKEKAKLKEEQIALEKQELEKKKLAKQDQEKKVKLEQQKKDQADKAAREKDAAQRKQETKDAANLAKTRDEQLKRFEKLAGSASASASNSANGTATISSGPSASYAGKIVASIRPHITYPENVSGNPRAEVEIRAAPSGTILSARITQSSGIKSWDEAVLRAIDKTETLPKDIDGTVQSLLVIGFRPKD